MLAPNEACTNALRPDGLDFDSNLLRLSLFLSLELSRGLAVNTCVVTSHRVRPPSPNGLRRSVALCESSFPHTYPDFSDTVLGPTPSTPCTTRISACVARGGREWACLAWFDNLFHGPCLLWGTPAYSSARCVVCSFRSLFLVSPSLVPPPPGGALFGERNWWAHTLVLARRYGRMEEVAFQRRLLNTYFHHIDVMSHCVLTSSEAIRRCRCGAHGWGRGKRTLTVHILPHARQAPCFVSNTRRAALARRVSFFLYAGPFACPLNASRVCFWIL